MDSNNFGILVEDALDESDFTTVSSTLGKDSKEIVEKIQKLEKELLEIKKIGSNNEEQKFGPSMMKIGLKVGKDIGKMENEMEMLKKDNVELKNGMAKMMKELEGIQSENLGLKAEVGKLVNENAEKEHRMKIMKAEIEEIQWENLGFKEEIEKLGKENAEKDKKMEIMKAEFDELKEELARKGKEMEAKIVEFKEEIGKMDTENVEKDKKFEIMKAEFDGLKSEMKANDRIFGNIDGIIAKLKEKMLELEQEMDKNMDNFVSDISLKNFQLGGMIAQNGLKLDELKTELDGLKEGTKGKNNEMNAKIVEFKEEIERKTVGMNKQIKELAFLIKRIDGIYGMELVKYGSSAYKLNPINCGPILTIHEDGFVVNHQGPNVWKCISANLSIPELNAINASIAFYYEVQILKKIYGHRGIGIGFCGPLFPLEGESLGDRRNSLGIYHKKGMWIDGEYKKFGNDEEDGIEFLEGDVVGVGLINLPSICSVQCFATCNGKFLWKDELPAKYAEIELFPALTLFRDGLSVRVNFGKEEFRFEQFNKKAE